MHLPFSRGTQRTLSWLSWLSWGALALSCASLRPSRSRLGAILESCWHPLGPSWATLEPSWGRLGPLKIVIKTCKTEFTWSLENRSCLLATNICAVSLDATGSRLSLKKLEQAKCCTSPRRTGPFPLARKKRPLSIWPLAPFPWPPSSPCLEEQAPGLFPLAPFPGPSSPGPSSPGQLSLMVINCLICSLALPACV